jgi:RNA polymerase sigma-70 factor (family 1)
LDNCKVNGAIKRLTNHSDEELCLLLKQGGEDAFGEIYERYWERLYTFAFHRTHSPDDSFDVTQELFVSLWTRRMDIEFHTSLSGYLYASIRYQIIKNIRSSKLKERYLQDFVAFSPAPVDNSNEETLALHELENTLERSLEGLPKRCQEIFKMSRKQNRSIEEIAKELNISQRTVENQLTIALRHLRVSLGEFIGVIYLLVC